MSTPTTKNLSALIELPESGAYTYAEKITQTRIYGGAYTVCVSSMLFKNTIGTGAQAGYCVESSTVVKLRGDQGKLTIVWTMGGDSGGGGGGGGQTATLPVDQVSVSPENLSPRLEKHPRYASLAAITDELSDIETAIRGQDAATRDDAYLWLSTLGKELVDKIRQGHESYYMPAIRYVWTSHSWSVPMGERGGYIQSPQGPLAGYFSGTLSWLREADAISFGDGVWKITRSWLGGPDGHWDADIYAP